MNTSVFRDFSPILIVGQGRSGSTLLQMILNAHPNIAIYGEVRFFNILKLKKELPSLNSDAELEKFFQLLNNVEEVKYLADSEIIFSRTKSKMKEKKNRNYESFYKNLLEEFAAINNAKKCGEKTCENVRYLAEIAELFPQAQFLHIIRDPRAVVASRIPLDWTSDSIIINALKWKVDILYSQEFAKTKYPNYYEVKYENLVANPEVEIKRILTFLGESYDAEMMNFYQKSQQYLKNEPWKEGTCKPISNKNVEKWRKELTESQVFLVEKIIGTKLLKKFDYEPAKISFKAKMQFPITLIQEIIKHLKYKRREQHLRKQNPEQIYENNQKLNRMMWKAILQ